MLGDGKKRKREEVIVVDNDDEPKVVEVPQAKAAEQVLVVMVDK